MCSGRVLLPGAAAGRFAASRPALQAGSGATELASGRTVSAADAAFCGGMLAHADETDDSHENARLHPGCAIVPAALAAAEQHDRSVIETLDAIVVGYDVAVAINLATWSDPEKLRTAKISTHHIGGLFGALAAVVRLQRPSPDEAAAAFSYAVQHAGGSTTWLRDVDHIEKSVVFGGLPARSAVFCAELAALGFTGVPDPFAGNPSFFSIFSGDSAPERIADRLSRPGLALRESTTKRYPAGMPIQAVCEAIDGLLADELHGVPAGSIRSVLIELPLEKAHIVDNSAMDDVNCQLVAALQLATGRVDFATLHSLAAKPDAVAALRKRVDLIGTAELDKRNNGHGTTRIARVTVDSDRGVARRIVVPPIGCPERPFAWADLRAKAREVLESVGLSAADVDAALQPLETPNIGAASARELMRAVWRGTARLKCPSNPERNE
jgi:2-methylcitrate dehydratase PrpD